MRFIHDQILRLALPTAFAILAALSFSFPVNAQETTDEPAAKVNVPDAAMRQVVNRVLKWYFKPRAEKKIIYLASDGVDESWLPKISNIEFRLLPTDEIQKFEGTVYLFTVADFADGFYSIGFAMGDPNCAYTGDYWHFRIIRGKVHLWENGIVGSLCSS